MHPKSIGAVTVDTIFFPCWTPFWQRTQIVTEDLEDKRKKKYFNNNKAQ